MGPTRRVFAEAAQDHALHRWRDEAQHFARAERLVPLDCGGYRRQLAPAERTRPGRRLVEHDSERPDVGRSSDRLALELLGGHISRRAHRRTLGCDARTVIFDEAREA